MHHDIDPEENVSLFFRESRKKCFAAAYTIDKAIATLFGRPPRISSQYSTQKLPLDLTDDETMAEGDAQASNMSKLTQTGWNTDGVVRRSSWLRVRGLLSLVREDILHLSLATVRGHLQERALSVLLAKSIPLLIC
jgi:hypothetical protein